MAVDVDGRWRAWSEVAMWISIVAQKWYNDSGIAVLVLDIAKVGGIWKDNAWDRLGVLVFRLDEDDGTTIRDLCFGNDGPNALNVA